MARAVDWHESGKTKRVMIQGLRFSILQCRKQGDFILQFFVNLIVELWLFEHSIKNTLAMCIQPESQFMFLCFWKSQMAEDTDISSSTSQTLPRECSNFSFDTHSHTEAMGPNPASPPGHTSVTVARQSDLLPLIFNASWRFTATRDRCVAD